MRHFRPGFFSRLIYPGALFRIKTKRNEVCLTFDDGPDPGSTPKVLEILGRHQVTAIFFCTGSEAEKFPELMELIKSGGHVIGNHGFMHLKGWKTTGTKYFDNINRAAELTSDLYFRPPYGVINPFGYNKLKQYFKIIFWDLMPYDFDPGFGKERSLRILKTKMRPGSVIVLHDRSTSTLLFFLEEFLDFAEKAGYSFVIPDFAGKAKFLK